MHTEHRKYEAVAQASDSMAVSRAPYTARVQLNILLGEGAGKAIQAKLEVAHRKSHHMMIEEREPQVLHVGKEKAFTTTR